MVSTVPRSSSVKMHAPHALRTETKGCGGRGTTEVARKSGDLVGGSFPPNPPSTRPHCLRLVLGCEPHASGLASQALAFQVSLAGLADATLLHAQYEQVS